MAQAQNLVTVTSVGKTTTIVNNSKHVIVAWRIGAAGERKVYGNICEPTIPAGGSQAYELPVGATAYKLDGVLFDDGSIQGPNTWRVDKHYKLWQQIQAGGPAYYSKKRFGQVGNSKSFANMWAREFHTVHGFNPIMAEESDESDDPGGPPGDGFPSIIPETFIAQGWLNSGDGNQQTYFGLGPDAECKQSYIAPGIPRYTSTCSGNASCDDGGADAYATWYGASSCPLSVLSNLSWLQDDGDDSQITASGTIVFTSGVRIAGYCQADCEVNYCSPPVVNLCDASGN
jgi:hypothetical protein